MMEKSNRPQRNRRHSRRAWPPEDDLHYPRPAKRLFTPEIKRMLKEWLVRRRENPYPSRDEKKRLAINTGLTYTQICNWFANWRRKLKNAEREKSKKSWGHLIKNYNTNAKGNVEQFSISSEDSIWEEEEQQYRLNAHQDFDDDDLDSLCDIDGSSGSTDTGRNTSSESAELMGYKPNFYMGTLCGQRDHSDLFIGREVDVLTTNASCQVTGAGMAVGGNSETKTKYKQKIMEKYLRDTFDTNGQTGINFILAPATTATAHSATHSPEQLCDNQATIYCKNTNTAVIKSGAELSKWLESAAKFTPNKNNYFIEWNNKRNKLEKKTHPLKAFSASPPGSFVQQQEQQHQQSQSQQQHHTSVTLVPLLYSTPIVQAQHLPNTSSMQHIPKQHNQYQQLQMHQQKQQQQHSEQPSYPSNIGNDIYNSIHHKDELDAAEALANLAFNCRQRLMDSNMNGRATLHRPLNAISS